MHHLLLGHHVLPIRPIRGLVEMQRLLLLRVSVKVRRSTRITRETCIDNGSLSTDPHNLRGEKGATTSATFNQNSFDYTNVSISWDESADIGEHSCSAWFDTVVDGCDVP